MAEPEHPKLCLSCALRRLGGKEARPCADCALLNIDPLAGVRAVASRPSRLARFKFPPPTRSSYGRGSAPGGQRPPHRTSWERGE